MDLVRSAGVDVSDWPNYERGATHPGANPKYCYEWALKQPGKLVVCNLWTENMLEINGRIEQHLVLTDTPEKVETDPTRRARRRRMATLLFEAAEEALPIRVIVLDGKRQEDTQNAKPQVKYRALDPEVWAVIRADKASNSFVIRRGASPSPYADQFELNVLHPEGAETTRKTSVNVRSRSREVRMTVLQRADGKCEYCEEPGFPLPDGRVYLETHHIIPLSQSGPDVVANVAALCANHHREAHHGKDSHTIALALKKKIGSGT
ncbi:MAG: HNH endonuclease signature motif containing protein [Gammaproteobacteria bacterium]